MKLRDYCERIGHPIVGRLVLAGNRKGGTCRIYMDEAGTLYTVDIVTEEVQIMTRRK